MPRTEVTAYILGKILACGLSGGGAELLGSWIYVCLKQDENMQWNPLLIFVSGMLWAVLAAVLAALSNSRYIAYGGEMCIRDRFYVEPYGWVFADPSFGGSAWRSGNTERWNYYFGNLDIFRMPANSEIQMEFMPEKKWLRGDPIDNQRGEFEYEDHGLRYSQLEVNQELISMRCV